MKSMLYACGLGKVMRGKPVDVSQGKSCNLQEQGVCMISPYLEPYILRQVEDHITCASLFAALEHRYHNKKVALCTSSRSVDDEWILDCACTYHICYIRDLFSSYSALSGSVLIGNDHPCQFAGI